LPAELNGLDDAVLTRTTIVSARDIKEGALDACGVEPAPDTDVIERIGLRGSSLTFARGGSSLYGCDKIPDPFTAEDPDLPLGGIWCSSPNGHFDGAGALYDPRLGLCPNTDGEYTAFAWVEPQLAAKWVVVSDAGAREVYAAAESLPVRVTTTENVDPAGSASFAIEEYAADGSKLREYTLHAQVAG
jgi:hypothetical protein